MVISAGMKVFCVRVNGAVGVFLFPHPNIQTPTSMSGNASEAGSGGGEDKAGRSRPYRMPLTTAANDAVRGNK